MKQELEDTLFTDFPLLYNKNDSIYTSCMGFGFECGDGWYGIIRKLSEELYPLVQNFSPNEYGYGPKASQVKEKFGALRFYMSCETDEMADLIAIAEAASEKTCEMCGEPGYIDYKKKWLSCRCEKHRE